MKTLIVEDEKHARENLERLLKELEPTIEIQAKLDSVKKSVAWLKENQPDLIFLDIHLADDLSFRIFEQVQVDTPIIFTTAYDQYAIQAFKVNSIDYLLKPIEKEDLAQSLEKYKSNLLRQVGIDITQLISAYQQPPKEYQTRFMVTRGEKIQSVTTDEVAYFEGEDRYVYLVKKDGRKFIIDYKLSDLEELLQPRDFFRLNRSFITRFDSITDMFSYSKSRVKVQLSPTPNRDVVVSSEKSRSFKEWLNR